MQIKISYLNIFLLKHISAKMVTLEGEWAHLVRDGSYVSTDGASDRNQQ